MEADGLPIEREGSVPAWTLGDRLRKARENARLKQGRGRRGGGRGAAGAAPGPGREGGGVTPVTRRRADNRFYDRPGQGACWRCKTARVATPRATRADGMPQDRAMFCDACIDRCHEATDFAHVCQICASPEEARYYGWAVRA